jgi:hypothetical protein
MVATSSRRSASASTIRAGERFKTLTGPVRNRTESPGDLPQNNRAFPFRAPFDASFGHRRPDLRAKHRVIHEVVQNRHSSNLPFHYAVQTSQAAEDQQFRQR